MDKKEGQSLHHLKMHGKTAMHLHQDLIDKGFRWKEAPLLVDQGKQLYWKTDGRKTSSPTDRQVIKIQIYIHADGSMVRIKARGVPDPQAKYPKRLAHVVMAVLKKFDPADCQKGTCNYDTSYENEAFKITSDGFPNPKAASQKHGFYPLLKNTSPSLKELNSLAADIYMDLVHLSLKTSCPTIWDDLQVPEITE